MSNELGDLELELTADASKLIREIEQSERIAKQKAQSIQNALSVAFDGNYEGKGQQIGEGIVRGIDGRLRDSKGRFVKSVGDSFGSPQQYERTGQGIGSRVIAGMQNALKGSGGALSSVLQGVLQGVGQNLFSGILNTALAPLRGGFDFIGASVDQANKIQVLTTSLKFVSGNSQEAATNMKFLRESSDQLGYSLSTLIPGFNSLAAATRGTLLEGQETRNIFYSIAEAGRVLGLSNEQIKNALVAVSQMASKGTVSMEELRGQLGEALPGAIQIFARSMGVSVAEFMKLVESGSVGADKLAGFARQINKEMGSAVPESMKTAAAATTTLQNTIEKLQEKLGKGLSPATTAATQFLSETLTEIQDSSAFDALTAEANNFANLLKENPQYAKLLGDALSELLESGVRALVIEAQRLLEYLEQNPEAIKQAISEVAEFGSGLAAVIKFCGDVARTLKSWDDWLGQSNDRFSKGSDNLLSGVQKFLDYSKEVLNFWSGIVEKLTFGAVKLNEIVGQGQAATGGSSNESTAGAAAQSTLKDPKTREAYDYFRSQGLTVRGASYLVGNLIQESGLDPNAVGDGGKAHGLAQWHPDRRQDMPQGFRPQLAFVIKEMQRDSPNSLATLRNEGASVEETRKALQRWERYGVEGARYSNGAQIYQEARSGAGSVPGTDVAAGRVSNVNSFGAASSGRSTTPSGTNFNAPPPQQQQEKIYPVIGDFPVTSGYGNRQHPTKGGIRFHDGIDIGTPTGTPIVSPMSGKVIRAGGTQGKDGEFGGYGRLVEVQLADKTTAFFAHLDQVLVKTGQEVVAGQKLGTTGDSGDGTGPHLHIGASDAQGRSMNPAFLLNGKRINAPNRGTATGSDAVSEAQSQAEAAKEARELLQRRRANEKARTDRMRLERDRDLDLKRQQEDAQTETAIAQTTNPQLKAQLENQRSITQRTRGADDSIRKAQDDLQDLIAARTAKIQDGSTDGIDFSKAIEKQREYIAGLEQVKAGLSEAPRAEWANQVAESMQTLTKSTNEGSDAVFDMANQYENGDSPAMQHLRRVQEINAAYDSQKQKLQENIKSARELYAVAPSADLKVIIGRNEENLRRIEEGQRRAIERANAIEAEAEKERQKQGRIDQINADGERRNTLSGGRLGLLGSQISFGNTIGADTRNLQREEGLLREGLRYQDQIDGLKVLHEQGKISATTLQELTQQAQQANSVNLSNIKQQFSELREIITDGVIPPFKTFVGDLLTGTKSVADAFKNMISGLLQNLAQLAVNKLFQSLLGGLFGGIGGSGIPDIASPILNFSSGGDVPTIGGNALRSGYGEISDALRREGSNSVLAALTPGERVLNIQEAMAYRKMFPNGIGQVMNFSMGGDVGMSAMPVINAFQGQGQSFQISVPVTVGSDSRVDPALVAQQIRGAVNDEILRQQRPGGSLY